MDQKFSESDKSLKHELCLAGTVVAYWSFTQEVAGSTNLLKILYLLSLNSFKTFRGNREQ